MKTETDYKVEFANIIRQMEAGVHEEQDIRADLQEKLNRHQQAANTDSQAAEGRLRKIQQQREALNRRKTQIEGILEYLEQSAKEQNP